MPTARFTLAAPQGVGPKSALKKAAGGGTAKKIAFAGEDEEEGEEVGSEDENLEPLEEQVCAVHAGRGFLPCAGRGGWMVALSASQYEGGWVRREGTVCAAHITAKGVCCHAAWIRWPAGHPMHASHC